jgi:hypothetical protein
MRKTLRVLLIAASVFLLVLWLFVVRPWIESPALQAP